MFETLLAPLRAVDWQGNITTVAERSRLALQEIAGTRGLLQASLTNLAENERLVSLCEHYDILDKLVLHDDDAGFRIRLHVFGEGYFDRPHNHRWTYTTLILRGQYAHTIFLSSAPVNDLANPPPLIPLMTRFETVGACYTLGTEAIHSITASPLTVSLVLRGPSVRERFFVMDRDTGKSWWQYGRAAESLTEQKRKAMSSARLSDLTNWLLTNVVNQ